MGRKGPPRELEGLHLLSRHYVTDEPNGWISPFEPHAGQADNPKNWIWNAKNRFSMPK
jgi:hypothetical protein